MRYLIKSINTLANLLNFSIISSRKVFFGFINNRSKNFEEYINNIKDSIISQNQDIRLLYENKFSSLIGNGRGLSFASCRMAFYFILSNHKIGKNDEVLILGFNCSVMVNAILKTGATPIYYDIDLETFGSCPKSIETRISSKTKAIVVQHSFGIPCKIQPIKDLAKSKNILLIEDCALSLGSEIEGRKVGTFGDYAIFSTDHSKPFNTMIGGFLYTENSDLFSKLSKKYQSLSELCTDHQKIIYDQLIFEIKYCNFSRFKSFKLLNFFRDIFRKMLGKNDPYLRYDTELVHHNYYEYPSKMPIFLCQYGLEIMKDLKRLNEERVSNLALLKEYITDKKLNIILPAIYYSKEISIIPNRIIWNDENKHQFKRELSKFLDVADFWFESPIISSKLDLKEFLYSMGSCPNSEHTNDKIMNLPTNMPKEEFKILLSGLMKVVG